MVTFGNKHYEGGDNEVFGKVVVPTPQLVSERKRTATLWRTYWETCSDGGKRNDPTMRKLNQVASEDFTWDMVMGWNLR